MTKMDLMLFRMIKNSKSQFLAVLIIIVVGICIYTSLSMVSDNMYEAVNTYYDETHFPHLFIEAQAVPASELDRLRQMDGVQEATGSLVLDVPVLTSDDSKHKTLRLITVKEDIDQGLSRSTLQEGRPLSSKAKEILLIGQYAQANNIRPGDEISIQLFGVNHRLKVAGIVLNPEYIYMIENVQSIMPDDANFGVCYINEAIGRSIMGESQNYNYIRVQLKPYADEKAIIEEIESSFKPYGLKAVLERENQLSNTVVQEELSSISLISDFLPMVFLITAGFILMMILSRMVKNDRLKIGVLKAIGYGNTQILMHYMKYAIIVGLLGGLLGALAGLALADAMTDLFLDFFHIPLLKFQFHVSYLFSSMILTSLFCIASGLIGVRDVVKINPADAMQNEPPKSGRRILLESLTPLWKRFSFSRKLVLKNIFRNKKRTIFVISGVVVTYALMMFATTMPAVVDQMMNQHFSEFQKMDYDIGLHKPIHERTLKDLNHIAKIDLAEGKIDLPFELSRGNKKQSVNVIGLDSKTRFYQFTDSKGKPVSIDSGGILLSENLAKSLNVKKGDLVQGVSYFSEEKEVLLSVAAVIKQTLGMNAYMDLEEMQKLFLEKNLITGILINSKDDRLASKLFKADNVATVMSTGDVKSVYEEYMSMIFISITFMLVFSGIIGFCVVYISTMVSINEREGEFSSLRVLGFTKAEIFKMIRRENNIITVAGIILGIPMGILFSSYSGLAFSTDIYTLDMTPTLSAGIWSGVFTVIFVIFAQLATYRKIYKLDFLQALKNRAG